MLALKSLSSQFPIIQARRKTSDLKQSLTTDSPAIILGHDLKLIFQLPERISKKKILSNKRKLLKTQQLFPFEARGYLHVFK